MEEKINPLWENRDKKIQEFELGIARDGIEYLKKINKQINNRVKEKNFKTKSYIEMQKQQLGESENGEKN